jgi:transposase-like protein
MAKSILSAPHFQDEIAAFAYVEAHLWPHGPTCPHCGNVDQAKIGALKGATTRIGLRKCYECKKPFTVRMGTIFESSHLALRYWLQVIHLMCASKKGISTRQIQRMLQCSMKTAWHLSHRIRAAMDAGMFAGPLGGAGKHVEADETFIGNKDGETPSGSSQHKRVVLSLVERGGHVRSFHVDRATMKDIAPVVSANVHPASTLNTDEARLYTRVGKTFAAHQTVNHKKGEYVRGTAYTNTLEGYFSVFKRGMIGVYQHCGEPHLHRYLAEFDFRYNHREKMGYTDAARADEALKGVKGKRLTYQTARGA